MAPLSGSEVRKLAELLVRVFGFFKELRDKEPLAWRIKLPQIPTSLSESLAAVLLEEGQIVEELKEFQFTIGEGNSLMPDITARKGDVSVKIEVKSTGKQAFQEIRDKDTKADYLIWIHFGEMFERGELNHPIIIFWLQNPGQFFTEGQKIVLEEMKKKCGEKIKCKTLTFDAL